MSHEIFEIYPKDKQLYFIEFNKFTKDSPYTWTLFKRNPIEPYPESPSEFYLIAKLASTEGHPWNLNGGIVNENDICVDMNTRSFLKFMVDALNEKVNRMTFERINSKIE